MKQLAVAFLAGVVFAVGLGISGMTDPGKIIGFLDVTGRWDPSLAFVMVGAIGVHVGVAQWALRARRPLWSTTFHVPRGLHVDASLLAGAAIFGLGWGAAGYCPGPALVDLAAPSPARVTFVVAMVAGMGVFHIRGVIGRAPSRIARRAS